MITKATSVVFFGGALLMSGCVSIEAPYSPMGACPPPSCPQVVRGCAEPLPTPAPQKPVPLERIDAQPGPTPPAVVEALPPEALNPPPPQSPSPDAVEPGLNVPKLNAPVRPTARWRPVRSMP